MPGFTRHKLPVACRPTLALGADSGSTVCLAEGKSCLVSEPIGDLAFSENFDRFRKNIKHALRSCKPEIIACDMHPGYHSARYAEKLAERLGCRLVRIQHHRAHVAATAAEHGLKDYAGIACDGLGYGDDNKLWGGEVFSNNKRAGHLEEQRQVGGDSAAVYPEKMLFGILSRFMEKRQLLKYFPEEDSKVYLRQLEQDYNVFITTSSGRILDAVSALLGVCRKRTYEGEPAIKLEKFASKEYLVLEPLIKNNILSTTHLFRFLVDNLDEDKRKLAATAQVYIAAGLYRIASVFNKPIVFSGGVANNKMISGYMKERGVLLNKKIPCGDAGISYGQAYLANISEKS